MRLLFLALLVPLAGCSFDSDSDAKGVPGSGAGGTRSYAVADFSKVDLRGSDDVTVQVGGAFAVRAEGDSALLDQLVIEKRDDVLRIGRRNGFHWSGSSAKVTVTMPAIAGAKLGGSADLRIDRVKGKRFDAELGGSGSLSIAAIEVEAVQFALAGSGDIAVAGTAGTASFSIAGSGDIDAARLHASGADVSIVGSGSVVADVDGVAKVSILGSGDVDLGPKAHCTTSKLGSGKFRCG